MQNERLRPIITVMQSVEQSEVTVSLLNTLHTSYPPCRFFGPN
jgi:hypothetical protein